MNMFVHTHFVLSETSFLLLPPCEDWSRFSPSCLNQGKDAQLEVLLKSIHEQGASQEVVQQLVGGATLLPFSL